MKTAILQYLQIERDASFFALARDIPGFSGDFVFAHKGNTHLVIWPTVSEAACEALTDLLDLKLAFIEPVPQMVYGFDGASVPNLPIANRPDVSTDHWLPAVLTINKPG